MPVFLFTDIEGSTRLWEEHTAEMGAVIARHDALLRQQVTACGGRITKHTGDGVTAAFEDGEPLACALRTQTRFAAEPWDAIGELRIRVGLHAGTAEWIAGIEGQAGDYFGPPVNCAARIMSAAWGGQILLTPEASQASPLPAGASLKDLGQHLLKDVGCPQQLYQLVHPDLPRQAFPPPRTLSGQSIHRAVGQQGAQMAHLASSDMAVALVSATLLPAVLGDLPPGSPALAGNVGVLRDLGAAALAEFLSWFAAHLQAAEPEEVRRQLEAELRQRWAADAGLRRDASRLLQAVHGVDATLAAATGEVREALARGLAGLGSQFDEFRWVLGDVQEMLADVRARQGKHLALQREQLDLQQEQLGVQLEQLARTEELLALHREPEPSSLPAAAEALAVEPRRPAFLEEGALDLGHRPVFVARERELAWLEGALDAALAGQGRVAFVTGGPGRGKTALLDAFARQAMHEHHELLVASGTCDAYSGVGDPYLPFREVLGMLTGDVEARWAAGAISRDHALRLWGALPATVEALLAHGPHVSPALVPGEALLARASAACPNALWLGRLRERVQRGPVAAEGLEQSHLFQQVSNVLRALAEEHPLLLILDDLQWVDRTSAGLLFHLGRRMEGARILIAGTYRPEEIAPDRQGEPHPLEKALAEFKRTFGDVWLDLAEVDVPEGRRFVDALLETEPNGLGEGFRQALAGRAEGHPLFTVELLRAMQERGDLVQDEDGRWVEGPALDWDLLPARVEGAIGERIERLEEDLRQILTVASVEGEDFTAEVVAQVQSLEARDLVRRLSGELQREHRLVRAQGLRHLDARRLALYRFQHHLFQKYLYNHLDPAERAYLHEDVGTVLEALYGTQTDEVAVQLARHFVEAGVTDKAARYLARAGTLAAARYANEEAIAHYSRALVLLPEADGASRYALLLAREELYDLLGQRDAQQQDLAELELLAEGLDVEQQAEVAARRSRHARSAGDFARAVAAARTAVSQAHAARHIGLEVKGHSCWGGALYRQGDYAGAQAQYEEMLTLARDAGQRDAEANALSSLAMVLWELDNTSAKWDRQRDLLELALSLSRQAGNQLAELRAVNGLVVSACCSGHFAAAWAHSREMLRLSAKMGNRKAEELARGNFGHLCDLLGDHTQARSCLEKCLHISREIESPYSESRAFLYLAMASQCQAQHDEARSFAEEAVRLSQRIGAPDVEEWALLCLGAAHMETGDLGAARAAFRESLAITRRQESLAGLAGTALAEGDLVEAQSKVAEILATLDAGQSPDCFWRPSWIYLTCYRVLQAVGKPRATEILATAHRVLMENADRAPDDRLRRSYLENVPWNREIMRLAREAGLAT